MDVPTRDQAIETLGAGQAALDVLLTKLSDEELTRPATIGGGDWSAKDLLGHIAFWEELAVETLAEWRVGRRPSVEQIGDGGASGVDAANARNQERTARESLETVRARAATAHAAILEAIREMSDEEWSAKAFYPNARRATLAERLGSTLGGDEQPFGHVFDHLPDLQAYVESLGPR
jgi:hypothetical protein